MELDDLRKKIDACDSEIVRIINERATFAQEIGRVKREEKSPIYAPHREQAVYDKVTSLNQGPLPAATMQAIYREIMSGTIALEGASRIAYMGPNGSFSHMAAIEKFGSSVEYLPQREIRDVFLAVGRDHADYGIVPLENSTEGSINQTNDMFMETDEKICSEIFLPIHHNLMANCPMSEVRVIMSHPQPLAQCRMWLAANITHVDIVEAASTTAAARRAAEEHGVAAIASEAAAQIYGVNILERRIEDNVNNMTRFAVISHEYARPTGKDRTTISFSLKHKAGSLYDALLPFRANGVNLTRIESRPSRRRAWEYTFFLDMEGHAEDEPIARAVREISAETHDFRLIGSYPRAEHVRLVPRPVDVQ